MMIRHLRITGRVQGVGYRAGLAREASARTLRGWVRNRLDGSVEALVAGDPAEVEGLLAWARRGPGLARVDAVTVADAPADCDAETVALAEDDFTILPTV